MFPLLLLCVLQSSQCTQCGSVSALDLRLIDYSYKELHYFVLVVNCGHAQVTVVCFFIDFGTWVNKTLNLQCVLLGFSHRQKVTQTEPGGFTDPAQK